MFVFELLIYVFFAWVMFHLAKESRVRHGDTPELDRYLWGYMLFFTLISAIRWRVGVDSESYILIFRKGEIRENSEEYVWDAIVRFVHDNSLHFTIGTAIAAFLQIFFLTDALKRYRNILIWLPVVMFGSRYYLDLMNGVRQMIVACGFVFLSRYIVDRKPIKFGLGILILAGIHHSALILLPTYLIAYLPLSKIDLSRKRLLCIGIFVACVIAGQTPSFQSMVKYLEPVLSTTGYSNYSDFYTNVLSGDTTERLSFGPMMISYFLLGLASMWYAPLLKIEFGTKIKYFDLWYLFAVVFNCGYFLVCNVSHIMIRPFQYLEMFTLIILSLLISIFYQWKKTSKRNEIYFWGLLAIVWISISADTFKAIGSEHEAVTYKTFFDRIK